MLSTTALVDLRNFIKRKIAYAQYKVGSTYYDVPISEIEITSDGIVRVKYQIATGRPCTITGARLISTDGNVWASADINVVIEDSIVQHMQWFDFNVVEEEVS